MQNQKNHLNQKSCTYIYKRKNIQSIESSQKKEKKKILSMRFQLCSN